MAMLSVGIFGHQTDASLAIESVKEYGIKAKNISVVTKQINTVKEISKNTGIGKPEAGAGNSGLFGTAKGIAAGLHMQPDTAVAAGPAAPKLAGAELAELDEETAEADGLTVSLIGLGIPAVEAEKYAKHAAKEHIIVIVLAEKGDIREVNTLFDKHHAVPLDSL